MATVHRATRVHPDGTTQAVALKRILPHLAHEEHFVSSFKREAHLGELLNHANIITVYEQAQVDGEHYIAMEYLDGWNLRDILRLAHDNGLTPGPRVSHMIVLLLSRALAYAHARKDESGAPLGLVHRDVSPANVIISRAGVVKIIDFGIARSSSSYAVTQNGAFKGKLGYMAPEALQNGKVDARADLWSLGVLAHELVTGRSLFDQGNDFATIEGVRILDIPSPAEGNPDCSPELAAIIMRALERDVGKRWQSANEMAEALAGLATQIDLRGYDETIANWCAEATGEAAPVIAQDHQATRVGMRPTAGLAGQIFSAPKAEHPVPRITFRPATITEVSSKVRALPLPPAGMTYLHTSRSARGKSIAPKALNTWPSGTKAPPLGAATRAQPLRAAPRSRSLSMMRPTTVTTTLRATEPAWKNRSFRPILALVLCAALALAILLLSTTL